MDDGHPGNVPAPCTHSADECDICERVLTLLRSNAYWDALKSVVFLESKSDKLQIEGFNNFRDALNHLGFIAQTGHDATNRDLHMAEVMEHFRRAFTHPFQDTIDKELDMLERRAWLYHLRSAFAGDDILSPRARLQQIDAVKLILIEIRNLKGQHQISLSAQKCRACYDALQEIKFAITPSRGVMPTRIGIWVLAIVLSAILGIVATLAVT